MTNDVTSLYERTHLSVEDPLRVGAVRRCQTDRVDVKLLLATACVADHTENKNKSN